MPFAVPIPPLFLQYMIPCTEQKDYLTIEFDWRMLPLHCMM